MIADTACCIAKLTGASCTGLRYILSATFAMLGDDFGNRLQVRFIKFFGVF